MGSEQGFLALATTCGVSVGFAWERAFHEGRNTFLRRFAHWSRRFREFPVSLVGVGLHYAAWGGR